MKKLLSSVIILSVFLSLFTSCGNNSKPIIGIIQFGSHMSLNNCYNGIIEGLKSEGINLDDYDVQYLNSNFDSSVSQTQANTLVNKGAKIIISIATPSALASANAAQDSDIPVVFCSVTDSSVMKNYQNITGTSDVPNFDKQLEVITDVMKSEKLKIGVLFSTEESSSPFQIELLKKAAEKYPEMSIETSAVADIVSIDSKVNELISRDVDCFINLLDNTIVGKLESNILPITNEKNIPVFGSEIEQVKVGCVASASIDYVEVGKLTGISAAKILNGTPTSSIPVSYITDPVVYYNSKVAKDLGLNINNSDYEDVI